MGEVTRLFRLARERARQRRTEARRLWRNMSLRTAFIWYVLIAAVLATAVCMIFIKLLDEPRIALYRKYAELAEEVEIPEGGSYRNYVTTDGSEVYIIFNSEGETVGGGEVPYGEGKIEIGLVDGRFSLFIRPAYSQRDLWLSRFLGIMQVASLPICYLGGLLLCALAFWRRRLRGPIVELERASARIAQNDLAFRLEPRRDDELGRLTESFETMRSSLETGWRELWAQMEERRRLNAAFAHDLRTPLTVLKGHADMLCESLPAGAVSREEAADELAVMRSHIARLENYVDAMGRLQRLEDAEIHRESVPARAFAEDTADSARIICAGLETSMDTEKLGETLYIDAEAVMQVLENILSNASRYAKSRVWIELASNGEGFSASVSDDGPGFAAEALAKAANPFYKGRESTGEHLGLGLNICDILTRRHGGSLTVSNRPGGGAVVTARFGV